MIIPVRCMACGKVIADKWEEYVKRCEKAGLDAGGSGDDGGSQSAGGNAGKDKRVAGQKTARGIILDELGIVNICCRIAMQTHVDMSLFI